MTSKTENHLSTKATGEDKSLASAIYELQSELYSRSTELGEMGFDKKAAIFDDCAFALDEAIGKIKQLTNLD